MLKDSSNSPNKDQGKYGPVAAIFVTIASYFGSYLVFFVGIGIILTIWAAINGGSLDEIATNFESTVLGQFSTSLIVYGSMVGLVYAYMRRKKVKLTDVGFSRKIQIGDVSIAVVTFVVYYIALIVIMAVVANYLPGVNVEQEQQLNFDKATEGLNLIPIFIALAVLPPLVEEFVMRGFLFTGLRNRFKVWPAAIITSIVFSIAHLQLGAGAPPLYVAAIDTFVLSMFLVYLRVRTGSIWASIVVHALKNSLAFLALFVFKVA